MISVARAKDSAKTQEANKRSKRERERYVHRADRRLSRSRRSRLAIEIAITIAPIEIAISRLRSRLLSGFDDFFLGFGFCLCFEE